MNWNSEFISRAHNYAIQAHQGQTRRDSGLPYVTHCERVAKDVYDNYEIRKQSVDQVMSEANYGIFSFRYSIPRSILVAAALLHDTVEDTTVTLSDIAQEFGEDVAKLVFELTSDKEEIKRIGKTAYLVNKINTLSPGAQYIKLYDRLDNITDYKNHMNSTNYERAVAYAQQTIEILKALDRTHPVISNIETVCDEILAFQK